jgi:DtxR family Mn-dependent transcriptional regulator
MQKDEALMAALRRVGGDPGETVSAEETGEGVVIGDAGETGEVDPEAAGHIFVRRA